MSTSVATMSAEHKILANQMLIMEALAELTSPTMTDRLNQRIELLTQPTRWSPGIPKDLR